MLNSDICGFFSCGLTGNCVVCGHKSGNMEYLLDFGEGILRIMLGVLLIGLLGFLIWFLWIVIVERVKIHFGRCYYLVSGMGDRGDYTEYFSMVVHGMPSYEIVKEYARENLGVVEGDIVIFGIVRMTDLEYNIWRSGE